MNNADPYLSFEPRQLPSFLYGRRGSALRMSGCVGTVCPLRKPCGESPERGYGLGSSAIATRPMQGLTIPLPARGRSAGASLLHAAETPVAETVGGCDAPLGVTMPKASPRARSATDDGDSTDRRGYVAPGARPFRAMRWRCPPWGRLLPAGGDRGVQLLGHRRVGRGRRE